MIKRMSTVSVPGDLVSNMGYAGSPQDQKIVLSPQNRGFSKHFHVVLLGNLVLKGGPISDNT